MEQKWTVLLLIWALLNSSSSINWMAGGNFTEERFSILMAKVNAFNRSASVSTYIGFTSALSTELNTLWAPAWNVIIAYHHDGSNSDVVLCGYAFNEQWFWMNGVLTTMDNKYVSFVIWKDYNCIGWRSIEINYDRLTSTFTQGASNAVRMSVQSDSLQTRNSNRKFSDIWGFA